MLILARHPNESLVIAGNITVTVLGFNGSQIRIGITAPPDITIDRAEVHQRKLAERTLNPSRATAETCSNPSGVSS